MKVWQTFDICLSDRELDFLVTNLMFAYVRDPMIQHFSTLFSCPLAKLCKHSRSYQITQWASRSISLPFF